MAVVVSCTALLFLLFAAPSQAAMDKSLQDDALSISDDPAVRAMFWSHAKELRVKRIRTMVRQYDSPVHLSDYDRLRTRRVAEEARAHGIKVTFGVYAPINRLKKLNRAQTLRISRNYTTWIGELAANVADIPGTSFLTWNEPNYKTAFPTHLPAVWAKLSNDAYRSIKRADPNATVVVGEFAPFARAGQGSTNPGTFLRQALCVDSKYKRLRKRSKDCQSKLLADAFGIHPYEFTSSPSRGHKIRDVWTMGNIKHARTALSKAAKAKVLSSKAAKNLWVTEFGYKTAGREEIPQARAASWTKSAWNVAKRNNVKVFSWYQLRSPQDPRDNWQTGLLDSTSHRRSVFAVYQNLR